MMNRMIDIIITGIGFSVLLFGGLANSEQLNQSAEPELRLEINSSSTVSGLKTVYIFDHSKEIFTGLQIDLNKLQLVFGVAAFSPRNTAPDVKGKPLDSLPTERIYSQRGLADGYSLTEYLSAYDAIAAMSGGYLSSFDPPAPLGLVKIQGVVLNSKHESSLLDSIVCISSGQISIDYIEHIADYRAWKNCIQAGPMLWTPRHFININDSNRKLYLASQLRSVVCLNSSSVVTIGISDEVTLLALRPILFSLDCESATLLTGASTAGLVAPSVGISAGHSDYSLPNALILLQGN